MAIPQKKTNTQSSSSGPHGHGAIISASTMITWLTKLGLAAAIIVFLDAHWNFLRAETAKTGLL
jgi:hypothetical protein